MGGHQLGREQEVSPALGCWRRVLDKFEQCDKSDNNSQFQSKDVQIDIVNVHRNSPLSTQADQDRQPYHATQGGLAI